MSSSELNEPPGKMTSSRRKGKAKLLPLWETEARSGPKMEARAHVLEAAAAAFMKSGYAATTLDDVADRLGTTKGQIYHYYRSKMDLYFDVAVGAFFMINDKASPLADLPGVGAAERLRRVAEAHALVIVSTFPFQRVALEAMQHQMIGQPTPRQHRAMARILHFRDEYEKVIARLISEGAAAGEFEVLSVEFATQAVLGSINWLTIWFDPNRSDGPEDRAAIAARIAHFVVAGLLPAPRRLAPAPPA